MIVVVVSVGLRFSVREICFISVSRHFADEISL